MIRTEWMSRRRSQLDDLMRTHDWSGNDPFDLVNAPSFRRIPNSSYATLLALSKLGARLPGEWLRRLLRVPRCLDPKIYVCAYFGYVLDDDNPQASRSADEMLERLSALAGRNDDGAWWGYDFVWPTLSDGVNPRRASTIVPGSFAILALAWDVVVRGRERHRDLLVNAARYYATRHWKDGPFGARVGYFSTSGHNTHNANLLGCVALTLGGLVARNDTWLRMASAATATSVAAVHDNGYIPYNDHRSGEWTDCFHHLYVVSCLKALAKLNPHVDAVEIDDVANRMTRYYRRTFLRDGGVVNYYPASPWPIDPHNYAASAIFEVASGGPGGVERAAEILGRSDSFCWDESRGHYHHRVHKRWRDRRLFMRWGQAWSFAALSAVLYPDNLLDGLDRLVMLPESLERER